MPSARNNQQNRSECALADFFDVLVTSVDNRTNFKFGYVENSCHRGLSRGDKAVERFVVDKERLRVLLYLLGAHIFFENGL